MKKTFSIFRDFRLFEKDNCYAMYKGIAVHQEYDVYQDIFWYTFRSEMDLCVLNTHLVSDF